MIKVLIADDHTLFRQSLISAFSGSREIKIVGEASDGGSCINAALNLKPDIILMDIDMPGMPGIEAIKKLNTRPGDIKRPYVVVLSMYGDKEHVFDSIRAGAMGYAIKDCTKEELLYIIKTVAGGAFMLHHLLAGNFMSAVKTLPFEINRDLTPREIELIGCVSRGFSNKQIASHIHLSERTVKNHLNLIFRKLGASNRAQSVNEAIKKGLISGFPKVP